MAALSSFKGRLAAIAAVLAALAFTGGAYTASRDPDVQGPAAFVRDVAKRMKITPGQLRVDLDRAARSRRPR